MMMNRWFQKIRRHNRKNEEEKLAALIVEQNNENNNAQQEEVALTAMNHPAAATSSSDDVNDNEANVRSVMDVMKLTKDDSRKDRRNKLKHCFDRNNCVMTVGKDDILMEKEDEMDDSDFYQGSLIIPRTPCNGDERTTTVQNCCVICLDEYTPGDIVVWSTDMNCEHAFHRACIIKYFVKMQKKLDGTPCPCCRIDFTDLIVEKKRRKRRGGRRRMVRTTTSTFRSRLLDFWKACFRR